MLDLPKPSATVFVIDTDQPKTVFYLNSSKWVALKWIYRWKDIKKHCQETFLDNV